MKSNRPPHFYVFFLNKILFSVLFSFLPSLFLGQNPIQELEKRLAETIDETEKAKTCNDLATAWAKKDPDQAINYAGQAIQFAKNVGDANAQILALNLRGDAQIRKKEYPSAQKDYENARDLLQKSPDSMLEGRTLHNLGKLAQSRNDPATAIQFYEKAFSIREKIGDKAGMGGTASNLGVLFFDKSEYEKSVFYYQKGLALKREAGDEMGIATTLANMAGTYLNWGKLNETQKMLEEAIEINRKLENTPGLAISVDKLGQVFLRRGNLAEAEGKFREAVELAKSSKQLALVAVALNNLGQTLVTKNEFVEATEKFQEGFAIAEQQGDTNMIFDIQSGLARIMSIQKFYDEELAILQKLEKFDVDLRRQSYMAFRQSIAFFFKNQFAEAAAAARRNIELAKKIQDPEDIASGEYQLAQALKKLGKTAEALAAINRSIALSKKSQNTSGSSLALGLKSEILGQMHGQDSLALLTARASLAEGQRVGAPLQIAEAQGQLSEIYRQMGRANEAVEALKKANALRDSVFSLKKFRAQTVLEKDFEFEKERKLQQAEAEKHAATANLKIATEKSRQQLLWILMAILLAAGTAGFYFWKNRQKIKAEKQQQATRERIARDLHDEVGSTLSAISILSGSAGRGAGDGFEKNRFENIGEKARNAMENMSDIVWAVNPENDSMQKVVERLTLFAAETLEAAGIELRFSVEPEVEKWSLPPEVRKGFYLIFKESVANCARHSRASEASIFLKKENGWLVFELSDDGVGLPKGLKNGFGGNGLKNMAARAKNIGADFLIENQPGGGAVVKLRLPLAG